MNIDSNGFDPEGTTKVADYIAAMFQGPEWILKRVDVGGKAYTVEEYLEVDSIEPAYNLFVNVMLRLKEKFYPAQ